MLAQLGCNYISVQRPKFIRGHRWMEYEIAPPVPGPTWRGQLPSIQREIVFRRWRAAIERYIEMGGGVALDA